MEQNMQYIYQVYRDGSFTKAAENLYLTQPALSMAVRREEERIGAALFDRSRHPLGLTQAGEAYIRTIEHMRQLEEDLERELNDLRNLHTGRLQIGGTHYLNCFLLAKILASFSRKYPGIQLKVSEDSSVKLAESLEKRELDLIFSCAPELVERFEHHPAFYDHILLAVCPETPLPDDLMKAAFSAADIQAGRHLSRSCPKFPLERFRAIDFILLQPGNNLYDRSTRMFQEASFSPNVKITLAQLVTAYRFAENGFGATFVSDRIICAAPSKRLLFFSIDSPQVNRLFYVLLPKRNYTTHAVKMFVNYATEYFQQEPGRTNQTAF